MAITSIPSPSYNDLLDLLADFRSMLRDAEIDRETKLALLKECSDIEIKLVAASTPLPEGKIYRHCRITIDEKQNQDYAEYFSSKRFRDIKPLMFRAQN